MEPIKSNFETKINVHALDRHSTNQADNTLALLLLIGRAHGLECVVSKDESKHDILNYGQSH